MEENKNVNGVENNQTKNEDKPTYEELNYYCNQLLMQRNQVAERLNEVTDFINKLPWLFKVLENKDMFPAEFVAQSVKEIQQILATPPKPEENKEENTDNNKKPE